MKMRSLPDNLDQRQLEEYLTLMVKNLAKTDQYKHLELSEDSIHELVKGISHSVLKNDPDISREQIENPQFMQKLIIGMALTKVFDKDNQHLFKALDKVLNSKKDIAELKKEMPKEMGELEKLFKEGFEEEIDKLGIKLPKPTPEQQAKEAKELEHRDPNSGILGLLCTCMTGGIEAVVVSNTGNLFGIVDVNPNHGTAFIDRVNDTEDNAFADPLGLNALAVTNYIQAGESNPDFFQDVQFQFTHPSPTFTPN